MNLVSAHISRKQTHLKKKNTKPNIILWIQLQISIQNYWEIETLLCIDHPITFTCSNWENLRNLIDVDISGDYKLSKVLWLVYGFLMRGGEAARCQWLCELNDTLMTEKDTLLGGRRPPSLAEEGGVAASTARVLSIILSPSLSCAFQIQIVSSRVIFDLIWNRVSLLLTCKILLVIFH